MSLEYQQDEGLPVPQDIEAERSIIATVAMSPHDHAEVLASLQVEAFIAPQHRAVWGALQRLQKKDSEINALTLKIELDECGALGAVGGFEGIVSLLDSFEVGRPAVLAVRIQDMFRRRKVMAAAGEAMRAAASGTVPTDDAVAALKTAMSDTPSSKRRLRDFLLSGSELAAQEIPPREMLVDPWLPSNSISMVYAPTGVGKTWFNLELSRALTLGGPFFNWYVPKPRRVLYIDGEMTLDSLQERCISLYRSPLPDSLTLLPSDLLWTKDKPLNLASDHDQTRVIELLEDMEAEGIRPDLIILDNLSSLVSGIDENGNSDQDAVLGWLIRLRFMGFAVMQVHHAGKGGDQRGASRRKDQLDSVIKLTPLDKDVASGAGFTIEFEKNRGCKHTPVPVSYALEDRGDGSLKWSEVQLMPEYMRALVIIRDHAPQSNTALGKLMDITRQAATKHVDTLRKKGLIHEFNLHVSSKGIDALSRVFSNDAA